MPYVVFKSLSAISCRNKAVRLECITRNFSHLCKIHTKHKGQFLHNQFNPYQYLNKHTSQNSESKHRHKLLLATYLSFGIGAVLITAIIAREVKRMRLSFKGIHEMAVPAWRRVKLYKYKDVSLPGFVVNQLDDIEKFEVRPDDVWVVSFPRSGLIYCIHPIKCPRALHCTKWEGRYLELKLAYNQPLPYTQ